MSTGVPTLSVSDQVSNQKSVRCTRAYAAGFGTAGALLAGVALVFILASAFVALHGWPQVGRQSAPIAVLTSSPAHAVAGAAPSRRLAAALGGAAGVARVGVTGIRTGIL